MSVLFYFTLVIGIAILRDASYEISDGENLFWNILVITLATLSLMLLFFGTLLEMT